MRGSPARDRGGCSVSDWVPIAVMAGFVGFPDVAAQYYLVVNKAADLSSDHNCVKVGLEPWMSLKGSPEEAIKRYVWRVPSRATFEAEVRDRNLLLIRFTLTHVGMSAYCLGYMQIQLRGWRQVGGKWTSSSARVKGDLPLHLIIPEDVVLWTSQEEPMPDAMRLLKLHDAVHAAGRWF